MSNKILSLDDIEKNKDKLFYHIGAIGGYQHLQKLHWEWYNILWGEKPSILLAYRGSFKSSSCVIVGIPFYLLFNPTVNILLVRASEQEAINCITAIQKIMKHSYYQGAFITINGNDSFGFDGRDNNRRIALKSRKDKNVGSVDGIGILQKITGRHYLRICFDDVVTIQDRDSDSIRESTKSRIDEIRNNILNKNHKGANYFIIGTCWHPDDAHSSIQKNKNIDIIRVKHTIYDGLKVKMITEKGIESIKLNSTKLDFECQYLLQLKIKDIYPLRYDYPYFDNVQKVYNGFMVWDVAFMQGGDYNAISIGNVDANNGDILVYGCLYKMDYRVVIEEIIDLVGTYNVKICFIDEGAGTEATSLYLQSRLKEIGIDNIPVIDCKQRVAKNTRILKSFQGFVERIKFLSTTDPEFVNMVRQWSPYQSKHKNDDAPDSLASLLSQLYSYGLLSFDFDKKSNNILDKLKSSFKDDFKKL